MDEERLGPEELARLPAEPLWTAAHEALCALHAGLLDSPPRRETVGRPGDPDFFRLEMPAVLHDDAGSVLVRAVKVIEERGARDAAGARRLGERTAELRIEHLPSARRAILDAERLTNLRTAAAAVLAVRYLVPRPRSLALIGTGRVATEIALAAAALLQPASLRVTSRQPAHRAAFESRLRPHLGAVLTLCEPATVLDGAEVAIAAVPAAEPVFTAANLAGVPVVVGVEGDPRVRLLASEVLATRPVLVDSLAQAARTGSLAAQAWRPVALPDGQPATLADYAAGAVTWDRSPLAVVLTGLAALDLLVGWRAWQALGGP